MQDRSGSMTCPATTDACRGGQNPMMLQTRWEATVAAANMFINSPQANGIGIGLGLFPAAVGNACMGASYATPVVAIAPLPGNAMPMSTALAGTMLVNSTPTAPALEGAYEYARTYTVAQMGARTPSVLLVTDGNPTQCNQTAVTQAVPAAPAGFMGTPSANTLLALIAHTL